MLTALITVVVTGVLKLFGVSPSAATLATTFIVVKVLVVLGLGGYFTRGFLRDRRAEAANKAAAEARTTPDEKIL